MLRRRLSSGALAPGRYLTDGRRLLRVLSKFDDGRSVMALLEDCFTLDAFAYALVELRAMGFRRVRINPSPPVAQSRGAAVAQAAVSDATGAGALAGFRSTAASTG